MRKIGSAFLRFVVVASFATSMGLSSASPAAAFTGDQIQHIIDCAGLMFTDPAQHAIQCGPGHEINSTDAKGANFESPPDPVPPKTCDFGQTTAFASAPHAPSLLLVQISTDCCPVRFTPPAGGLAEVIPVFDPCCNLTAFRPDLGDGAEGSLAQADLVSCFTAFRFDELALPGITI